VIFVFFASFAEHAGGWMAVETGSKAPDFTLVNQDRQPVTLSALVQNGPVVLAFFPGAFSSVCQNELCTFRDSFATLEQSKAQVVGVSTDTFFTLKAWADQQGFTFPLLSDYNKEVIAAYDVVNPDMIGLKNIAKRAVFVLDRDGVVRHREVLEDARNEPDYGAIHRALASI
jgi:glutaredoxin-dependent peroxiredoxin